MKKFLLSLFAFLTVLSAAAADFREHRTVWSTAYLNDWPSGTITKQNAEQHKRILRKNLDKFKDENVNAFYFHVRVFCDAAYKSSYEPWSKFYSGTRGVEPPFDPLEFVLEEAHARGIEVYAWINPYRYCGVYQHDDGPLEYKNTHPEWLIYQEKETILNPALEEVQQRICDVVAEIINNYDVDGIVFDDYFYSNPTPLELDADLYNAAKAADPTVGSHIEWRAANVNKMVDRVYDTIKSIKPYVVFGISPAGVASPPNIESNYGLEPAPDYDWQYDAIASDPLNWYKEHNVDFMAPQIYWPSKFDALQTWWAKASNKFQRHLFTAVTLSDFDNYLSGEYVREVLFSRELLPQNQNGVGFFRYGMYKDSKEKIDGKIYTFDEILGMQAYNTPALMPLRPWNNVYAPVNVTGLKREGNILSWDAVEGMRYTLYCFEEGQPQMPYSENLVQVLYTNSYEIPEEQAACTFGVAVYDRFANEYSMSTEGASLGEAKSVKLTYPANGEKASDLFDFAWEDAGCSYTVEVATDADFKDIVTMTTTSETSMSSFNIPNMEEGKTYYWRVRTHAVNAAAGVSETYSFIASRIAVTGPNSTAETITPTITWTPAYPGASYRVEIARNSNFNEKLIDYTAETTEASHTVADANLVSGYNYYVRVTATRNGRSSVSDIATFATADVIYDAPKFINPQTDGAKIHSNECITVEDWKGLNSVTINISETDAFPTRKSYKTTLKVGETSTPELSTIKVASKALVDGQTYFVRTYGSYFTQDSKSTEKKTDYTVSTFVYSSEAGISDIIADNEVPTIDSEGNLSMPLEGNDVNVYAADGTLRMSISRAGKTASLASLPAGLYIVKISGPTPATIKFTIDN